MAVCVQNFGFVRGQIDLGTERAADGSVYQRNRSKGYQGGRNRSGLPRPFSHTTARITCVKLPARWSSANAQVQRTSDYCLKNTISAQGRLDLVGVRGFEPPTPASRRQCSTRLSYTPTVARDLYLHFWMCKGVSVSFVRISFVVPGHRIRSKHQFDTVGFWCHRGPQLARGATAAGGWIGPGLRCWSRYRYASP